MKSALLILSAGLLLSTATLADEAAPTAAPGLEKVSTKDDLRCIPRYHEGQIIGQECRTERQWKDIHFRTQQDLADIQLRSLQTPLGR